MNNTLDNIESQCSHKNKIFHIFNVVFFVSIIIGVFIGMVRINIITTKMFSPYGNGSKQYELIKDKLGEDFKKFTKDDSGIKIYEENNKITIVKIGDKEYKIKY